MSDLPLKDCISFNSINKHDLSVILFWNCEWHLNVTSGKSAKNGKWTRNYRHWEHRQNHLSLVVFDISKNKNSPEGWREKISRWISYAQIWSWLTPTCKFSCCRKVLSQSRRGKLSGEDKSCQMPPGKSGLSCVRDSLCGCHYNTFLLFQSPGLQATLAAWIQRDVTLPWLGTSHLLPGGSASTVPTSTPKWKGRDFCKYWHFFMCLWIFGKLNWAKWH